MINSVARRSQITGNSLLARLGLQIFRATAIYGYLPGTVGLCEGREERAKQHTLIDALNLLQDPVLERDNDSRVLVGSAVVLVPIRLLERAN